MIGSIEGKLLQKKAQYLLIACHGLGYKVHIPLNLFAHLPEVGENLFLYTSHIIREDGQTLYGFFTEEKKELFELLITVSGIGPKIALSMLGHFESDLIQVAIKEKNPILLSKVPGIGKKTAERVIIELQDKISHLEENHSPSKFLSDAIAALINLGYSASHAKKAVEKFLLQHRQEEDLATIITGALKML